MELIPDIELQNIASLLDVPVSDITDLDEDSVSLLRVLVRHGALQYNTLAKLDFIGLDIRFDNGREWCSFVSNIGKELVTEITSIVLRE